MLDFFVGYALGSITGATGVLLVAWGHRVLTRTLVGEESSL